MKNWAVPWRRSILAAIAVAATAAAHARMDTAVSFDEGRLFVPDPEHARLSSLGFETVVADYYWLQALQLVGGDRGNTVRHSALIGDLIDLITRLDPWVGHPYRFAAIWLTENEASVRMANRLLRRGIAHDPLEWRNPYHLGFNHFYYLEENLAAADAFESALSLPGAPKYLGALVARLRLNTGGLEMAAGFLTELAQDAPDGFSRAEYLKALDEVETERHARALDSAREEFWRRNGRDIERVEDLIAGADPILRVLPPAHPNFDFPVWVLDDQSGQIVSTYFGTRYRLHVTERDEQRLERWRKDREEKVNAT